MGLGVTGGVTVWQQSVAVQRPEGQGAVGTTVVPEGQMAGKFSALQVGTRVTPWQQSVMEQMELLQGVEGSTGVESEGHLEGKLRPQVETVGSCSPAGLQHSVMVQVLEGHDAVGDQVVPPGQAPLKSVLQTGATEVL